MGERREMGWGQEEIWGLGSLLGIMGRQERNGVIIVMERWDITTQPQILREQRK